MRPVKEKPHLCKSFGIWVIMYDHNIQDGWLADAFRWAEKKNKEMMNKRKLFGTLDLRYNPDRHGAIK